MIRFPEVNWNNGSKLILEVDSKLKFKKELD